jgi:hypothetical protein
MAISNSGFGREKRKRFLDALAATCNVRIAAGAAGIALSSCYRLRARDRSFADAWQQALAIGYDRLEDALLDYALSRIEADEIDPEAVDPAAIEGSAVVALARRSVSNADLQFAIGLLNRHRAAVEGRRLGGRGARRATAEETDAALTRKLDALARQLGVA